MMLAFIAVVWAFACVLGLLLRKEPDPFGIVAQFYDIFAYAGFY